MCYAIGFVIGFISAFLVSFIVLKFINNNYDYNFDGYQPEDIQLDETKPPKGSSGFIR